MQNEYYEILGIDPIVTKWVAKVELTLKEKFATLEDVQSYNQLKILHAFQSNRISDAHFNWQTGYGYDDMGREGVEKVYKDVFKTEDAIVRPLIVNGTHALTLCLTGLLGPKDSMLSITGKPYDTLEEVIGIKPSKGFTLKDIGVQYDQIELIEGAFDEKSIMTSLEEKSYSMVYIQRSAGYSWRKGLSIENLNQIIDKIKSVQPNTIVMVDNCYGEFLEKKEPTEVGCDIMAGSLIKNPGGGLALSGGYIVGKEALVEKISYRMTSPGIGKECGLTFGQTRSILQGLFMAPSVVTSALKGAIFCAKLFESLGYETNPKSSDHRSDIIQAIKFGSEEKVISFCQGIQSASPIDAFVSPQPWEMPGYDSPVIMAAGAFVQGSSIELSADAPIRPPYIAYFQGGLTYDHSKFGAVKGLQNLINDHLISIDEILK